MRIHTHYEQGPVFRTRSAVKCKNEREHTHHIPQDTSSSFNIVAPPHCHFQPRSHADSCTYSIPASRLGAGGAAPRPAPGSSRMGPPWVGRLLRQAAFVGQQPLLCGQSSGVVAHGSATADHSVARDEDGHLENRKPPTISRGAGPARSLASRARPLTTTDLEGLSHVQAPSWPSQPCAPLGSLRVSVWPKERHNAPRQMYGIFQRIPLH